MYGYDCASVDTLTLCSVCDDDKDCNFYAAGGNNNLLFMEVIRMIIASGDEICGMCGKRQAVVICNGCEVPLCKECQMFEMWCYGCGHADTKAFCYKCYHDIDINPYGGGAE